MGVGLSQYERLFLTCRGTIVLSLRRKVESKGKGLSQKSRRRPSVSARFSTKMPDPLTDTIQPCVIIQTSKILYLMLPFCLEPSRRP